MKKSMLEYKGYHATIEFDAEDNIFVGKVFGITDSLNFHGTSVDELETSFHNCIENYLEMCKRYNKKPNKEFKGSFNVRNVTSNAQTACVGGNRKNITLNQVCYKCCRTVS